MKKDIEIFLVSVQQNEEELDAQRKRIERLEKIDLLMGALLEIERR